jgi:hypothetical protein
LPFFCCGAAGAGAAGFAGALLAGAAGCGFAGCFMFIVFFSWLESDFHRMFQFTLFLKKEKGFLEKKQKGLETKPLLPIKMVFNELF